MFDKNFFKDAFRSWVRNNPRASEEEALAFCQANIPAQYFASHYWLVEQSIQWFGWLKSQVPSAEDLQEEAQAYADCGHLIL